MAAPKAVIVGTLMSWAVSFATSQSCVPGDDTCVFRERAKSGDQMLQKRAQLETTNSTSEVEHGKRKHDDFTRGGKGRKEDKSSDKSGKGRTDESDYSKDLWICFTGKGESDKVLESSKVTSQKECEDKCSQTRGCAAFDIDADAKAKKKACQLYKHKVPGTHGPSKTFCVKDEPLLIVDEFDYYEEIETSLNTYSTKDQTYVSDLNIPPSVENYNSLWVVANPYDGFVVAEDVEYKKGLDATMFTPQCAPPADGFAAVVIVPGKAGGRDKHKWQGEILGRRGIFVMTLDCSSHGSDSKDAVDFIKSPEILKKYPVDPNRIFLMGYSTGAQTVYAKYVTSFATKVAGIIGVNGIFCTSAYLEKVADAPTDACPLLAIETKGDTYIRPTDGTCDEYLEPKGQTVQSMVPEWLDELKAVTGKVNLIYYEGGAHQAPMNGDIYYEIAKFVMKPNMYQPPIVDWSWKDKYQYHHGNVPATWYTVWDKGCSVESQDYDEVMQSDGIMTLSSHWGGQKTYIACFTQCVHTEGCIGVDIFTKKVSGLPGSDKINCALFSKICDSPSNSGAQFFAWQGFDEPNVCDTNGCDVISTDPWVPPAGPPTPSPTTSAPTPPPTTPAPTPPPSPACTITSYYSSEEPCPDGETVTNEADCMAAVVDGWGPFVETNKKNGWMGGCYVDTRNSKNGIYWNTGGAGKDPQSYQLRVCGIC